MNIPFNKPYLTGKETRYIAQAVKSCKISGNGMFTKKCHTFFHDRFGFKKCLLTTSCTDALEMAAILIDCQPGDEIIIPSYTFVSTANAFVLRGAKVVFADSESATPNIDAGKIEALITPRTKAIVPVHYAGIACDMDPIMALAKKHNLFVIEDAAQAIDSYYTSKDGIKRPLGNIGHLAAFSFHETKNVISGEGGMLVVNDDRFFNRAEIIWEKGTNRAEFFRGEVDKYNWVDIGSSFLPSELVAAFLYAQLENLEKIQKKRIHLWKKYYELLRPLHEGKLLKLPSLPPFATNNGHLFYIVCRTGTERDRLIDWLRKAGVFSVFHYLSLHKSPYFKDKHDGRILANADKYTDCLFRLPLFYEMNDKQIGQVAKTILVFFKTK